MKRARCYPVTCKTRINAAGCRALQGVQRRFNGAMLVNAGGAPVGTLREASVGMMWWRDVPIGGGPRRTAPGRATSWHSGGRPEP